MEVSNSEVQQFIKNNKPNGLTTREFTLVEAFLKHSNAYTFDDFLVLHGLSVVAIKYRIKESLIDEGKDLNNQTKKYKGRWGGY